MIIAILLIFILCALQLQGVYDVETSYLILFGFWLLVLLIFCQKKSIPILSQRRYLLIYLFLAIYFITSIINSSLVTAINRCVVFFSILSPVLMYEFLKGKSHDIRLAFIFFISLTFAANFYLFYQFLEITNLKTLRDFNEYGADFYIMKTSFNTCYAVSLVMPALCGLLYQAKRRFVKALIVAIILFLILFLLRAQFMTAILVAFIGITLEIIYRQKWDYYKSIFFSIVFCCFSLFVILPFVTEQLKDSDEYGVVTSKLTEINDVLSGKKRDADDINTRSSLNEMSLSTFLENPIIGVNYKLNDKRHSNDQGIGNHAAWVDFLARYGICSVFVFIFLFISLRKQRKEVSSPATMISFIILGFFNPLFLFPQMFVTFLFNPLLYGLMKK